MEKLGLFRLNKVKTQWDTLVEVQILKFKLKLKILKRIKIKIHFLYFFRTSNYLMKMLISKIRMIFHMFTKLILRYRNNLINKEIKNFI
jgi:hypothetical protein